jgi:hypothetical protein
MRTATAALLIVLASLPIACKRQHPPQAAQPAAAAAAEATAAQAGTTADSIHGTIKEKIDVNQYSYLRIDAPGGEVWAAVPKATVAVGETVSVAGAMWMENFKSESLNRTWPRIAFGTLGGEAAAAPRAAPTGPGAGMFAAAAAQVPGDAAGPAAAPQAGAPVAHPPAAPAADVGEIKVSKASGAQGRTIADVYKQRTQLKEKPVAVRGKVVKVTNGVLGKNWLHLRDGTGDGPTADLAVASEQTAGVGATVLVSGTVKLDRDLGAGYHYDVIIEDAKVKVE